MKPTNIRNLALVCLALSAVPMSVRADSVVDVLKDYNQKRTQLIRDRKATAESLSQLAEEAAKRVDADAVTMPEILQLTSAGITNYKPLAEKLVAKLDGMKSADAKANATEKMLALHVAASSRVETPEKLRDRLASGLAHPGTAQLLNSDQAHIALMPISSYLRTRTEDVDSVLAKVLPMLENVKSPLGNSGGALVMGLWQVAETAYKEQATKREAARNAVVSALQRAYKATTDATPDVKDRYERMIDLLNGPATRGTLIGNQAPELDILWSTNSGIKSLASLKGKVVVLDFWALGADPASPHFPMCASFNSTIRTSRW